MQRQEPEDADALVIMLLVIFLGFWVCFISLFCDCFRCIR